VGLERGGCAEKPCSSDGSETGTEENLGSNFVGGKEGHSCGRNGGGREQEWAYVRTLLSWLDGRTCMTIHSDRPGSTGKGSYGRFPEEADYQCLALPRDAEGSTAWRLQGKAADDRDSNRRPVEDSTPLVGHFRRHASIPVPADPTVLVPGLHMSGTEGHC